MTFLLSCMCLIEIETSDGQTSDIRRLLGFFVRRKIAWSLEAGALLIEMETSPALRSTGNRPTKGRLLKKAKLEAAFGRII